MQRAQGAEAACDMQTRVACVPCAMKSGIDRCSYGGGDVDSRILFLYSSCPSSDTSMLAGVACTAEDGCPRYDPGVPHTQCIGWLFEEQTMLTHERAQLNSEILQRAAVIESHMPVAQASRAAATASCTSAAVRVSPTAKSPTSRLAPSHTPVHLQVWNPTQEQHEHVGPGTYI
jgi:hypothetical protein